MRAERAQLIIREAEPEPVPVLESDAGPQVLVDPVETCRVQREAPFVQLPGIGENADSQSLVETDRVEELYVVWMIHGGSLDGRHGGSVLGTLCPQAVGLR
jgi:hypothetical protein